MFTDVRGYGRIVEECGDAEAAKLLRAYARIVRASLPKRGVIAEQTADSFYLIFTSPADAARTALKIADGLSRHNDSHPGLQIPVSIGIDAGQTIRHKGGHVGAAPIVASRLTNRAQPGQVLVSEAVAALLRTAKILMRDLGLSRLPDGQSMHTFELRPPDPAFEGRPPRVERFLATILFTDIARSTATAAGRGGDRGWREMVEAHHAIVREQLRRHGGAEIDTAGDGFYATFDIPSRAIDCALSIRDQVRSDVGIDIRAGIHVGECEIVAGKIGGMGVVVGGRIKDLADGGEVFVSQTVRDLLIGSPIRLTERRRTALKGVPGEWAIYAVDEQITAPKGLKPLS